MVRRVLVRASTNLPCNPAPLTAETGEGYWLFITARIKEQSPHREELQ